MIKFGGNVGMHSQDRRERVAGSAPVRDMGVCEMIVREAYSTHLDI